jgi:hypothetical protein
MKFKWKALIAALALAIPALAWAGTQAVSSSCPLGCGLPCLLFNR